MSEALPTQKILAEEQLAAFYADVFVATQSRHFLDFTGGRIPDGKAVVDMGGGCGYFAQAVHLSTGARTRVIDLDRHALDRCQQLHGQVDAVYGDAVSPPQVGDEGIVCFNLVLHHLVGSTEADTRELQKRALLNWRDKADYVFVTEYVYESPANVSGRLIFEITSSRILSAVARAVSRFVPALRANTFGVGVRFRSRSQWKSLFEECGYDVLRQELGHHDKVLLPQRVLMIKSISMESFLLKRRTH